MKYYLGSDIGSGIETNNKLDFMAYVEDAIDKAEKEGREVFELTIQQ